MKTSDVIIICGQCLCSYEATTKCPYCDMPSMRVAFERWINRENLYSPSAFELDKEGNYGAEWMNHAWEVWQACSAANAAI